MRTIETEALVLSSYEYKEKDAIVSLLLEDQILNVLARGVQTMKSKNRSLIQPFSWIQCTYQERTKGFPLLLYGHVKKYYHTLMTDLEKQSICFVLRDCLKAIPKSKATFSLMQSCWNCFSRRDEKAYGYACFLLKEGIQAQGISPYLKSCVRCNRENHIETISIQDGGFLCSSCNHHVHKKWTKEDLIRFLHLFRADTNQVEGLLNHDQYTVHDFLFLVDWYEFHTGFTLSSAVFLKSVIK